MKNHLDYVAFLAEKLDSQRMKRSSYFGVVNKSIQIHSRTFELLSIVKVEPEFKTIGN